MTVKESVVQELEFLTEAELKQVAEYVAFLKFQEKVNRRTAIDEAELAALYAEFAEEDQLLAEEGLSEYAESLAREDRE